MLLKASEIIIPNLPNKQLRIDSSASDCMAWQRSTVPSAPISVALGVPASMCSSVAIT